MAEAPQPDADAVRLPASEKYRRLATDPETLYRSARKCWKGVGRKFSSQAYILHIIDRTVDLADDLANGRYREGPVRTVHITYPKKRTARSITFRDRTYQRGLNDIVLYPRMTRSFIWTNFACQKGKGTEAALLHMKRMLHNAWLKWRSNRFQILSGDIKGYYDNMRHDLTEEMFGSRTDPWTKSEVVRTLRHQYLGEKGYNPGSQMVQIAGISYLDPFDHHVKEEMRRKFYIRYMDDWHILGAPDEDMGAVRAEVSGELAPAGMWLHPDKTRVRLAKDGVVFLGFLFRVTETGKVLMFRDPKRVKEIKRRLRRLAKLCREGRASWDDFDTSFECVMACIRKGNSGRLVRNMIQFSSILKQKGDHPDGTRHQRTEAA
jgi:hypothetical protein